MEYIVLLLTFFSAKEECLIKTKKNGSALMNFLPSNGLL